MCRMRLAMEKNVLSIALATMLAGALLLELYVRSFEAKATGGAKVSVLVLTSDAPAGQSLARDKLGVRMLPEAYLESRHVRAGDIDKVLGEKLSLPERAGETLLWTDIAGMDDRRLTLSGLVSDGRRALTVHAARGSFSGLLEPGDRVDVLVGNDDTALFENLLVLAVGTRTDSHAFSGAGDDHREGACDSEVTLSVTSEQAQRLAGAERSGDLRLLLRNPDDVLISAPSATAAAERKSHS